MSYSKYFFAAACLALAWTGSAAAQGDPSAGYDKEQYRYCDNPDGKLSPDLVIGGCTALLRSGKAAGPMVAFFLIERAQAYGLTNSYTEAMRDIDQALAVPNVPKAGMAFIHTVRGDLLRRQKKYAAALKDYDAALAADPSGVGAQIGKAAALFDLERLADAKTAYGAVLSMAKATDEQKATALQGQATVLIKQGHREEAIEKLSQSTRLAKPTPGLAQIYRALGQLRSEINQPQMARQSFDTALALANTDEVKADILVRKGSTYLDEANWKLAAADFNKALAIDPDNGGALRGLGKSKLGTGDYAGAIADFTRSLQAEPDSAFARFERGLAFSEIGDVQKALTDFDAAVRLKPDNAWYRNGACWARAADFDRDYEQALKDCNEAVRLSPKSGMYLDSRGFVYLRLKQFDRAFTDYDSAVKLDPKHAHALYGRGIAAIRLGRTAEGRADIAKAAELRKDVVKLYADRGMEP